MCLFTHLAIVKSVCFSRVLKQNYKSIDVALLLQLDLLFDMLGVYHATSSAQFRAFT